MSPDEAKRLLAMAEISRFTYCSLWATAQGGKAPQPA